MGLHRDNGKENENYYYGMPSQICMPQGLATGYRIIQDPPKPVDPENIHEYRTPRGTKLQQVLSHEPNPKSSQPEP